MRSEAAFTRMRVASVESATQVQIISETPCLYFVDTTTGNDDWRACVDGDNWTLQQWVNDTTWTDRFKYVTSTTTWTATGNLTITGTTTLATSLTGVLHATSGVVGAVSGFVDNHVIRANGTGAIQSSPVTISDLSDMTGVNRLTVQAELITDALVQVGTGYSGGVGGTTSQYGGYFQHDYRGAEPYEYGWLSFVNNYCTAAAGDARYIYGIFSRANLGFPANKPTNETNVFAFGASFGLDSSALVLNGGGEHAFYGVHARPMLTNLSHTDQIRTISFYDYGAASAPSASDYIHYSAWFKGLTVLDMQTSNADGLKVILSGGATRGIYIDGDTVPAYTFTQRPLEVNRTMAWYVSAEEPNYDSSLNKYGVTGGGTIGWVALDPSVMTQKLFDCSDDESYTHEDGQSDMSDMYFLNRTIFNASARGSHTINLTANDRSVNLSDTAGNYDIYQYLSPQVGKGVVSITGMRASLSTQVIDYGSVDPGATIDWSGTCIDASVGGATEINGSIFSSATAIGIRVNSAIPTAFVGTVTGTAYGIKLETIGGTTKWGIYDTSGAAWAIKGDSQKLYFGAALDSYLQFDGSKLTIKANAVSGTDYLNLDSAVTITGTTTLATSLSGALKATSGVVSTYSGFTDNRILRADNATSLQESLVSIDDSGNLSGAVNIGLTGYIYFDTSNARIECNGGSGDHYFNHYLKGYAVSTLLYDGSNTTYTVGIGASAASRGVAIGDSSYAGEEGLSFGDSAYSEGVSALALGGGSEAIGYKAIAIGGDAVVDDDGSDDGPIAIGSGAEAYVNGVAVGPGAVAQQDSIAIGPEAYGDAYEIAIGDLDYNYNLCNVAATELQIGRYDVDDDSDSGRLTFGRYREGYISYTATSSTNKFITFSDIINLPTYSTSGTGSAATLANVGGTGRPVNTAQAGWVKIKVYNVDAWIPYWQ